jgi:hypothetical protein
MLPIFLLAINILLAACMLVAAPVFIVLQTGRAFSRGAHVVHRKLRHRALGATRVRRRVRSNIYPETYL